MKSLKHRFVEGMPSKLDDGILYISIAYDTILHRCACGCGHEVNTPLGRTDWSLTYNGETVSLWPSVGNWSFPCRSHYVIKNNRIHWAGDWSEEEVEAGRRADRSLKAQQAKQAKPVDLHPSVADEAKSVSSILTEQPANRWWTRLVKRIKSS